MSVCVCVCVCVCLCVSVCVRVLSPKTLYPVTKRVSSDSKAVALRACLESNFQELQHSTLNLITDV